MSLASSIKKEALFEFYDYGNINSSQWPQLLHTDKQQKGRLEAVQISFLRAMPEYWMTKHRCNENMWQELQTSDINSRIKNYQTKQLQHLGRMSSLDFLNCAQTTNPETQKTIKDAHIKAREHY